MAEQQYQVTARKWRPQRFDEVVGQDHITRTLKNAIREGRLAHGYLFTGQRGCGKTTVARLLAKAINCPNAEQNGYEPCNKCEICTSITSGTSMDVMEIDGASNNGVDDVREMRENVKYPPLQGKYRVVIIDEVHMLTSNAFNALLKTLEEPPAHLVFIFATTEVQKVLPTILSRTQRYDFRRMQIDEIVKHLRHIADTDGIKADDDSLLLIAKKADGSMRDGQSIFDQAVAFSGGKLEASTLRDALNLIDADFFFDVTDAIHEQATATAFALASDVVTRGYDVEEFIGGLLDHMRNILTVIVTGKPQLLEVVKHHQERYSKDAKNFSEGDILRLTAIGFRALERLKSSPSPRITLELMLVEMTLLERAIDVKSLIEEIRALKGAANTLPRSTPTTAPAVAPSAAPAAKPAASRVRAEAPQAPAPAAAPVGPSADVGMMEIKWSEFLESIGTKSIPFRMVADDIEFAGMSGSSVKITISKKFTDDAFARNRDAFIEHLRQYFGEPGLTIEVSKVEKRITAAKTAMPPAPKPTVNGVEAPAVTLDESVERTELEMALMKELGAVPL